MSQLRCSLNNSPVTSITGSIVISSAALLFLLAIILAVKCCHLRAKYNDRLEARAGKEDGVDQESKVISTVLALGQNCRLNHLETGQEVSCLQFY